MQQSYYIVLYLKELALSNLVLFTKKQHGCSPTGTGDQGQNLNLKVLFLNALLVSVLSLQSSCVHDD